MDISQMSAVTAVTTRVIFQIFDVVNVLHSASAKQSAHNIDLKHSTTSK